MGGAFKPGDVAHASIALVFYCVGIFAWAGQAIIARGFFAMQDTLTPIILGSIVTLIFVPLNYVLMKVMGHGGLALATSIAATIHLFGLLVLLRKRIDGIDGRRIAISSLRICAASAVMAVVCIGTRAAMANVLAVETRKGAGLTVLVAMGLATLVYGVMMKLLKAEEAIYIWDMVKRTVSRKPADQP
jgi:putative peptidoglycan lipid II flippase